MRKTTQKSSASQVCCGPLKVAYPSGGTSSLSHCPSSFSSDYLDNSDLGSNDTILIQGCSQVLEAGHFFQLLAVHGDVCTDVGRDVHHDLRISHADHLPLCSCSFIVC
ncbi:hypothetical protein DPMN_066460 [Dreissena polymorpha]|uniref:Uncharacterized protein n=1 Tax=Dreissena polymorpha TaxID=45954 RepID=A0A9D3YXW6_DREPO|nr:hypothetical protein DPMN_066460 [Dreissena polymorpha]